MKTNDIITCDLPLFIQKLYIKRLKHMIEKWECDNFCTHCPINSHYREGKRTINAFILGDSHHYLDMTYKICDFCMQNVNIKMFCPCKQLGSEEALKRAKDFIKRFEAQHEIL